LSTPSPFFTEPLQDGHSKARRAERRNHVARKTHGLPVIPQIPSEAMKKPVPATWRLRSVGVFSPAPAGSD
jgi:hypothetical protein